MDRRDAIAFTMMGGFAMGIRPANGEESDGKLPTMIVHERGVSSYIHTWSSFEVCKEIRRLHQKYMKEDRGRTVMFYEGNMAFADMYDLKIAKKVISEVRSTMDIGQFMWFKTVDDAVTIAEYERKEEE